MLTRRLSAKELHQLAHRLEQQHLTRGAQQFHAATETLAAVCQPQESDRVLAERQIPYKPTKNGRRRWELADLH